MDDIRSRLRECFATIFPDLPPNRIETATLETISEWDSIAMVTLISVVEEEFGLPIALESVANLNSFDSLCRYLTTASDTQP
jgi:acyl carrier protein